MTPIAAGAVACVHAILDPRPLTLSPAVPSFRKKETDDDIPCTDQHFRCCPFSAEEHGRYLAAVQHAQVRAHHSYFDQHIIRMDDGRYWVADEGSYETLMQGLVDRIVYTVTARLMDEY